MYARAAFGEGVSFLVGWVTYLSAIASTAAVLAGLASALGPALGLHGTGHERLLGVGLATALALACTAGIVLSARTWTTLTLLKLVPLVALVVAFALAGPLREPRGEAAAPARVAPAPSEPATQAGPAPMRAALTASFTYQGFEVVPVIASQVRGPERAIPFATLGSLGLAALLYLALQSACLAALPQLASSAAPLADAARVLGGPELARLLELGAAVSTLGISFGMIVVTPRYLVALARGEGLGLGLERMNARGVPLAALGVTWALASALLLSLARGDLFVLSGLAVQIQFVVSALALAALARRRAMGLRPLQALPALPAVAVGLALGAGAGRAEYLTTLLAVAAGLLLRALFRALRRR